ncbi:MAG: VWA domain-containing protein [Acidobacteria bacterium]|nr:VWA domain-containing protein [Acidobacteriota bacterium]
MRRIAFLGLMIALAGSDGFSQTSKPPSEQNPQFTAKVEVVNVLVTATDKKGRFVTELTQPDFQIYEDGKLQQITNFSRQTNLPLTIAFLIDTSSSVAVKLAFEKEAATNFIYSVMRENDKALLVEFDTGVTLLQDLTPSANEIVKKIAKLRAGGGTSLFDALYQVALQKLQGVSGRRVILILSDGDDLNSKATFEDTVQAVRRADITVYAIGTSAYGASGDHDGDKVLKKLTEETGGKVYFPYTASQMEQHFDLINQELRSQYNLAYESTNKKRDGSYRVITVKTAQDNIKLRHKKGYVARSEG